MQVVAERGLQAHAPWLNKCIQLYETYLVRHGIMLVGPSGAGKTAIMECLAAALTELGTKHAIWRMNPKARAPLPDSPCSRPGECRPSAGAVHPAWHLQQIIFMM